MISRVRPVCVTVTVAAAMSAPALSAHAASDAVVIAASGHTTACHVAGSLTDPTYCYVPLALAITSGDVVTWTNQASVPHNVTACTAMACPGVMSGSGLHPAATGSPVIGANGGTFTTTFTGSGSYQYYCTIHGYAAMHGSVYTPTPGTFPAAAPSPSPPRATPAASAPAVPASTPAPTIVPTPLSLPIGPPPPSPPLSISPTPSPSASDTPIPEPTPSPDVANLPAIASAPPSRPATTDVVAAGGPVVRAEGGHGTAVAITAGVGVLAMAAAALIWRRKRRLPRGIRPNVGLSTLGPEHKTR